MDARIDHCQKRLSDLDAYVDALEAFLDEEGNGQELIEGFRTDVAAVESGLAALEADVDETADEQQDLRDRIDSVEDEVAELRDVRDDVAALQRQFDETRTELRDEIDELRATVERFEEWQTNLASAFEDLSSPDA
jgi:chromosome segregation ATPase